MVQPAPTSSRGFLPRELNILYAYVLALICVRCLAQLSRRSLPNSSGVKNHPGHIFKKFWRANPNILNQISSNKNHVILISRGWRKVYRGMEKWAKSQLKDGENEVCLKEEVRHRKKITFLEDGWLWWRITGGLTDFMRQILQDFTRHVQAVQS